MPTGTDWAKLQSEVAKMAEKHALRTGAALSAWNLLQDTFGSLFSEMVAPTNHALALAIWYSQQSDKAQRDMLKAASKVLYGEDARIYKEMKWACKSADLLGQKRNNVVHVGYSIDLDRTLTSVRVIPRGTGSYSRADAMSDKDIFEELTKVEKYCKDLFQFVLMLAPFVVYPDLQDTWPVRPEMPKGPAHQS
jgi:hypothetical protein